MNLWAANFVCIIFGLVALLFVGIGSLFSEVSRFFDPWGSQEDL